MNYNELRRIVLTGDLLSCGGPWMFSRLIRWKTGQPRSHVGLAVWLQFNGGEKRLCILESLVKQGIRIYPLRRYLETDIWPYNGQIWWQPLIDPKIKGNALIDYGLQKWGNGYADHRQFLVIASSLLQFIRRKRGKRLDTNPELFHCAELVTSALVAQGFEYPHEPTMATPGDVCEFKCFGSPVEITRPDYALV